MIHGRKKWSTLTAAVLLALGALSLPQTAWAATAMSGEFNTMADSNEYATAYENGTAVGNKATASVNGTAVGNNATAGEFSEGTGRATAVGADAQASANGSVALGYSTQATHSYSVALGTESVTKEDYSVSVGGGGIATRTITNVQAGDSANDAAVWDQIAKTGQEISLSTAARDDSNSKLGNKNEIVANDGTVLATFEEGEVAENNTGFVSGSTVYEYLQNAISDTITITDNKIRVKNMAQSNSADDWEVNGSTRAWGTNAIAFGVSAGAIEEGALAIGSGAFVKGSNSTAVGASNYVYTGQSAAIGYKNTVDSYFKTANVYAFGSQNIVYGNQSTAIGYNNSVGDLSISASSEEDVVKNSYVMGSGNTVLASNAFVFGSGVTVSTTAANSVVLGNGSTVEDENTVSVGSSTTQRKIVHVAKGTENTDAATYGQIAKAGQVISLSTGTREAIDISEGQIKVIQHNQITTNDGTVLATFKEGTITSGDTGFVSGGTVYDYLQTAGTGQSLAGSDSITISNNKIQVANMAQSTSATGEVTNGATKAKGDNAIAFGGGAQADGYGSIAIGAMNYTDGDYTTTLGYNNGASADYSASIGYLNRASEEKTYAFGYDNAVFGKESSAVGVTNALYGVQSAAIGYNNLVGQVTSDINDDGRTVSGNRSYVVGADNKVLVDDAFVFGSGVTAVAKNSVVLGKGSSAEAENTVSVGTTDSERRIVHVANGTANTDAANFGQLIKAGTYSATSSAATTAQTATLASNDGASSVSISIAGEGKVAAGDARLVSGDTVYQYIKDNISGGSSGSAADVTEIKENITTEGGTYLTEGKEVGKNLKALDNAMGEVKLKEDQVAFNVIEESLNADGSIKTTMAENLMKIDEKIGSLDPNKDRNSNARALKYNVIDSNNTISENLEALDDAIDGASADLTDIKEKTHYENATASGDNAIALGEGSSAGGSDSISLGTNAEASKANALAFGNEAKASADSALALGNGAKAEGANAISFGTGAAASKENALAFGNKASASAANTLAFGNTATASAENAMAFGNGANATGSGSVAIGSGSVASEANVVSFGSEGSERRLTNVAAGVNDTDAVNVGQMNSAIGENFNYLKFSLTRDINKVAAGSAALAALRPEGFDPDDKFSMAVGFGHYKNANAGAIGAFYKPNYDTTFSIGATLGDGESMMNMGVSFKLGSRGKRTLQTGAALSQEVASLRETNESLKKDNASQASAIKEQAKEIADLKADNERMKADNERMKEQIAMILSKMELSDTVEKSVVK